jgi:hypothetical protein
MQANTSSHTRRALDGYETVLNCEGVLVPGASSHPPRIIDGQSARVGIVWVRGSAQFRRETPPVLDAIITVASALAGVYTILYRETVRAAKTAHRAINRINKLRRISGRWVFESHPHRQNGIGRLRSFHFACRPCSKHSATRSETFASPAHITVSAPPQ